MRRLRAAFKGKSLGGWIVLLIAVAWSAVDHLGRAQFVISYIPKFPDVSARLRNGIDSVIAMVSPSIAALWSPFAFQTVLLLAGLTWLFISTRSPAPAPEQRQLDLDAKPKPKPKPIDKNTAIKAASDRLLRFLHEGEALYRSNADIPLFADWEIRTGAFIRAAYGEAESERFFIRPDGGYGLHDLIGWRIQKITELGRRLEFTKVVESFGPQLWTDTR